MHSPFPLYAPGQLRELEARGIAACDGDALALMTRAGQAGWRGVLKHWPQARRIVVACGPGNNGGDGYVLARHALESGREVRVLRIAAPATPLAGRACEDYLAAGGAFAEALGEAELIVDALFGIGLSRAPEGEARALIEAVNTQAAPVFALDVPSGVDADRGSAPGAAVLATRTLQFIVRHVGLHTGDALEYTGQLALEELDLPGESLEGVPADASLLDHDALVSWLLPRRRNTHKGESGHVLCIGGDEGSGGAIALCAEAALRAGTGLVSVATRPAHVPALLARRPEAMVRAVESTDDLVPMVARARVVAVGPGLGQGEWGQALFRHALRSGLPLVVDADALNLLSSAAQPLEDAVFTPHPGEAARLLACTVADVQRDRVGAAQAIAQRYAAVVVLKGAGTVVASGQATRIVGAGNPGMAVGGMGDLLTGIIASLRAQGLSAFDAASAGALLHGLAGDAAAWDGERGLLPSDLLPHVRRLANP